MGQRHEQHLQRVISFWAKFVSDKYWKGQIEHGGNLWEKPGMLRHIEQETADFNVYLSTLRDQLTEVLADLRALRYERATDRLEEILGEPRE